MSEARTVDAGSGEGVPKYLIPPNPLRVPPVWVTLPRIVTVPSLPRKVSPAPKLTLPSISVVPEEHSKSPVPPSVTLPRTRTVFPAPAVKLMFPE